MKRKYLIVYYEAKGNLGNMDLVIKGKLDIPLIKNIIKEHFNLKGKIIILNMIKYK